MAIQTNPSYTRKKQRIQKIMFACFRMLSYGVALLLFFILGFILVKGIGVINWEFLTEAPTDGMTKGGIWPAIVGTFYLMIGSALFSFPIGVMSGIYMNEYAPQGKLVAFIRMMTNNLAGIPSIVFGLFGMAFFVNYLSFWRQYPGWIIYLGPVGAAYCNPYHRRGFLRIFQTVIVREVWLWELLKRRLYGKFCFLWPCHVLLPD